MQVVPATAGQTVMEALAAADLSDVWPGGACGGIAQCSTCRYSQSETKLLASGHPVSEYPSHPVFDYADLFPSSSG